MHHPVAVGRKGAPGSAEGSSVRSWDGVRRLSPSEATSTQLQGSRKRGDLGTARDTCLLDKEILEGTVPGATALGSPKGSRGMDNHKYWVGATWRGKQSRVLKDGVLAFTAALQGLAQRPQGSMNE